MTHNPTTKGMSEAEVLEVLANLGCPPIARSTIESTFTELARLRAAIEISDKWTPDLMNKAASMIGALRGVQDILQFDENAPGFGGEIMLGIHRLNEHAITAESDRTALLEVVRRLLPYAREAFEFQASEQAARNDVRDAEAILSRITAPEASR